MRFHAVIPVDGSQTLTTICRRLCLKNIGTRLATTTLDSEIVLNVGGGAYSGAVATVKRIGADWVDVEATLRSDGEAHQAGTWPMDWAVQTTIISNGFELSPLPFPLPTPDVLVTRRLLGSI